MIQFKRTTPMLKTRDLDATVRFYRDVLDFRIEVLWPRENPDFCILDRDQVSLSFYTTEFEGEGAPAMTGQVYIDVEGVQALFESLRGKVEVEWGPEVYHYGRREFAIRDNNGYRLVFSEPVRGNVSNCGKQLD